MTNINPGSAPKSEEPYISTATLAVRLGVNPATITRSWIPQGCPYELELPRGFRFYETRVKAWLAARSSCATTLGETTAEMQAKVKGAFMQLEARRKGRRS